MVDEWLRRNSTSRRIRKGINTHTSFLQNESPTQQLSDNHGEQDEIHHLNQQPSNQTNGVPPQSLTWKLENDGCQVRWKSPFSQVGHFSGEPCTPDGRFNGERNRNRHHYPLFRKVNSWSSEVQTSRVHQGSFANKFCQHVPGPKKSPFSAVSLNFLRRSMHEETPAIRGFWRPSRWDGSWSCLAQQPFWHEGVFRPRRFFWGKMET